MVAALVFAVKRSRQLDLYTPARVIVVVAKVLAVRLN
jgi:hypothetical protein